MSDARLRNLERAADKGGDAAHGQLLQERLRAGQVDREGLELLAYLHWPPAWAALDWEPHGHSGAPSEGARSRLFKRLGQDQLYQVAARLDPWAHGLRRWPDAELRAGVAAAWARYPSWSKQYDVLTEKGWDLYCGKHRIETLLAMIDLQIRTPGGYPLVYCASASSYQPLYSSAPTHVLEHEGRLLVNNGPSCTGFRIATAEDPRIVPLFAGSLGIYAGQRSSTSFLVNALEDCCGTQMPDLAGDCEICGHGLASHHHGNGDPDYPHDGLSDHAYTYSTPDGMGVWCRYIQQREERVFQAIRNELVPWVLGQGDPVQARIDARRQEPEC